MTSTLAERLRAAANLPDAFMLLEEAASEIERCHTRIYELAESRVMLERELVALRSSRDRMREALRNMRHWAEVLAVGGVMTDEWQEKYDRHMEQARTALAADGGKDDAARAG